MTTTAPAPGCPVDESFDPLSPGFLADPFAVMAKAGAPIFFAPSIGYYVVTRYKDVEEVFRDPVSHPRRAVWRPRTGRRSPPRPAPGSPRW
jgi:cytochrome P450